MMALKCLERCDEICQRRIGIVLFTLITLLSIGSLISILIGIL